MRKPTIALMAIFMLVVAPAAAEAKTKQFTVTIKAPAEVYYLFEADDDGPCIDVGPQNGPQQLEFKITGTVSPTRAGKYVTIYKKFDGGSGKVEGKARIRSTGKFTFIDRPTTSQARSYKAKMPALGSYANSYSKYTRVTIEGVCDE